MLSKQVFDLYTYTYTDIKNIQQLHHRKYIELNYRMR